MNTTAIEETIQSKLAEIERTRHVRIIYACESGSRAWGFASADSDYDVRFVYVRKAEDYLRLEKTRDVIEYELNDVYDINGWDVQKMLRLLAKPNPVIFEWADSPIVYRSSVDWERIKPVLGDFFSAKRLLYHYRAMAQNNIRSYFKADEVPLKKYLYVVRPLLACRWILKMGTPPPTAFSLLCEAVLPKSLSTEVEQLLAVKKKATEKAMGTHIVPLDEFISAQLAEIESHLLTMQDDTTADWEKLNMLFVATVGASADY